MNTNSSRNSNPAEEALDRGIERLISRELSDMVDYKSFVVDVQAARQSIISSTYFSSHEFLARILAEGAD